MTEETGTLTDAELATLDVGIGVDRSASMGRPSHRNPRRTRYQDLQEDAGRLIRAFGQFDSDGLTVAFFNSAVKVVDNVTADAVDNLFLEYSPAGGTDTAGCIRALTSKAVESTKPFVGVIWTDGEPQDEDDVIKALREAANKTKGRPKFGLVIIQTGNDPGATRYLQRLDSGLASQGVPDMVAVVTVEAAENLTAGQIAWLAQNK